MRRFFAPHISIILGFSNESYPLTGTLARIAAILRQVAASRRDARTLAGFDVRGLADIGLRGLSGGLSRPGAVLCCRSRI